MQHSSHPRSSKRTRARLHQAIARHTEALESRLLLTTATLNDTGDTYVRNNTSANSNFGSAPELLVQNPSGSGDTEVALLQFDLSSVSRVNSATLNLRAALGTSGDPSTTLNVFALSSSNWSAGSVTWNTAPTTAGNAINSFTVTNATPANYSVDLTSLLQQAKAANTNVVSLAIESSTPGTDPVQIDSTRNGIAPQIVVDTTQPAAPTASILSEPNVTNAAASEPITVKISGPAAINTATIGASNLAVTAPGGGALNISNASFSGSGNTVTATYTVAPPNGTAFSASDDGAYSVNFLANQVSDANSNFAAPTSGSFNVNIKAQDKTAPTASINAPASITTANNSNFVVTAVYTDNVAVSNASISASDLTISGKAGVLHASSVSTSPNSDAATITASYTFAAPDGGWNGTDNGTYTVNLPANAVTDTSGNGAAAASASFNVSISVADTIPPVASSISAPNITGSNASGQKVTVVYSDNVAVDVSTIATSNLTVTGAGNTLSVTGVTTSTNSNAALVTATYTLASPNNQNWSATENGAYTITVLANSVKDTAGNGVAAKTGSFNVNVPLLDVTPPTDQITAPNVTTPGGTIETITVVYSDNVAVSAASVDSSSLVVSGPHGDLSLLSLSKLPAGDSPHLTAIYRFVAPGGSWDASDNGTYNVRIPSNHVKDTSGNADPGDTATFTVNAKIPDTIPPTASINTANITAPGSSPEVVSVVYTDNVAVDAGTIQTSNLTVTGSAGPLTVSGVTTTGSGKTVTANYSVSAPGGAWAASANGNYTVSLKAGSVTDTSGNGVAAGTAAFSVNVSIPDTIPPVATIYAPNLGSAINGSDAITVIYSDAGNIKASTLSTSNLTVSGPNGPLTVSSVSATPSGDATNVTAVYQVSTSSGSWTYANNGTYTVTLGDKQVTDESGNAAPSQSVTFTVKIPNPSDPNDQSFNGGSPVAATFVAEAVASLPNGQVLVVGHQGDASAGQSQGVVEMLNANGSVDTSFGVGGIVTTPASANQSFDAVLLQSNGFVVAGSGGGFLLERYNLAGQLDTSFGTNGSVVTNFGAASETAYAIAAGPNNTIAAGGSSNGNFAFARYTAKGTLDTSFGQAGRQLFDAGSATDVVGALVTQTDGKLLAVGGSGGSVVAVRLNTDGNADASFGTGGLVVVNGLSTNSADTNGDHSEGLALQTDGKILIANRTTAGTFGVVRLNTDGSADTSFGTGGLATAGFASGDDADAIVVQPSGQIMVIGTTSFNGQALTAVAAFDPTGAAISSFGNNGKLTLPLSSTTASPAEVHIGDIVTRAFGARTSTGSIVVGTSGQTVSASASTTLRRLIVPGASVGSSASNQTFLGTFGISGKKNVKLTVSIGGVKVTLTLSNGSGQAYQDDTGLYLVINPTAKGASLTISPRGGRVTLSNVIVNGTLRSLSARGADLAGTLFATVALGSITLGNINGGVVASASTISSLSILNGSDASVFAGANLGSDDHLGGTGSGADTYSSGVLGALRVSGSLSNTVIGAGYDPLASALNGNTTIVGGAASIIKSISVKSIDAQTRFFAGAFPKSAKIGKTVKTATDPHFVT